MITATNFDYLNAKLHGMRSRLLEGGRLDDLAARHTLPEVARMALGEPLAASAGALERRLVGEHVADLAGLIPHIGGSARTFFTALLARYRIENLKVIIRWRAAREARTSPIPLLVPLPNGLEMSYDRLMAAPDLPALAAVLPEPHLITAAAAGLEFFEQTGSTFFVEAALDQAALAQVAGCHRLLGRRHRAATGGVLAWERDIYNLMFVVRAARSYGLALDHIEPFLASPGGRVSRADLTRIHGERDPAEIAAAVPASLFVGRRTPAVSDVPELERHLWVGLARMANALFYSSLFDLGMAVAFFYLKRVELFNLIRVVEGVRYGLGSDEIRKRLILAKDV